MLNKSEHFVYSKDINNPYYGSRSVLHFTHINLILFQLYKVGYYYSHFTDEAHIDV